MGSNNSRVVILVSIFGLQQPRHLKYIERRKKKVALTRREEET